MIKLAIDLGSSVTKMYRADTNSGVVLAEPSCVAITEHTKEIRAIGKEAKRLIGKTAEYTKILYPVCEGRIVNRALALEMLKAFLSRIDVKGGTLRRTQALFSIPCGLSDVDLAEYELLAEECGLRKAWFVEQPYLSALGCGAVLSDSDPIFCLDIGGGVTNIAVLSGDGIITGLSMNIGGNNMDDSIVDRIIDKHELHVGALTAERIKNEIGSLSPTARGTVVAQGSSTVTRQPTSASVQAVELNDCICVYVDKIVEYAAIALRNLSAEVSATVNRGGVYLSGGIMKMQHVPQYISSQLGMRFRLSEEPQFATVLGGGVLLRDKELLLHFSRSTET